MKTTCALCRKPIHDEKEHPSGFDLCVQCGSTLHQKHTAVSLHELLNRFDFPVLIINDTLHVVGVNKSAIKQYGEKKLNLDELLCGEVIECMNSRLPGGCGKTVHCTGCAIRKAVIDTYTTGNASKDIDSYHDIHSEKGNLRVHYLVTTEKIDNAVLVKITSGKRDTVN